MSRTINLIEVSILSYTELRTIMNKDPVQHLEEVPFGNFQLELDLCDEVYEYSVQSGYGRCYMVSVNGDYAGYMVIMSSEMIHHKGHMQAVTDSFYIKPEYRSAGTFNDLLVYVEEDLRKHGIRFLTLGMNPNMPHVNKVKQFVHDLGYMHTEYSVTKEL